MFFRLPTLTPGYIRLLQTQAFHNMPVTPPAEKTVPGVAMLLGAVGIGMCGYSSKQLALHHRPSTRVLHWVGSHTDAGGRWHGDTQDPCPGCNPPSSHPQEIPPPSFVGQKFP